MDYFEIDVPCFYVVMITKRLGENSKNSIETHQMFVEMRKK